MHLSYASLPRACRRQSVGSCDGPRCSFLLQQSVHRFMTSELIITFHEDCGSNSLTFVAQAAGLSDTCKPVFKASCSSQAISMNYDRWQVGAMTSIYLSGTQQQDKNNVISQMHNYVLTSNEKVGTYRRFVRSRPAQGSSQSSASSDNACTALPTTHSSRMYRIEKSHRYLCGVSCGLSEVGLRGILLQP